MFTFKGFLNEMYNFFPKSVEEIDKTLTDFSPESKEEIKNLYSYLKGKSSGSDIPPINIDLKKQNHINISRSLANKRLLSLANSYLENLRQEARIVFK